ncbi:hypothetical protein VTK26DRAFT_1911 [Humicola hyalothermophila]
MGSFALHFADYTSFLAWRDCGETGVGTRVGSTLSQPASGKVDLPPDHRRGVVACPGRVTAPKSMDHQVSEAQDLEYTPLTGNAGPRDSGRPRGETSNCRFGVARPRLTRNKKMQAIYNGRPGRSIEDGGANVEQGSQSWVSAGWGRNKLNTGKVSRSEETSQA